MNEYFDYSVFHKNENEITTKQLSTLKPFKTLSKRPVYNQPVELPQYTSFNNKNNKTLKPFKTLDRRIKIRVHTLNHEYKEITMNLHDSLEDLFIAVYNELYPKFYVTKEYLYSENRDIIDFIPPKNIESAPIIEQILVCNQDIKNTEFRSVPNHRFITLDSFIQANKDCFKSLYMFKEIYAIYIIDNIFAIDKYVEKENKPNLLHRIICSIRLPQLTYK
jgi:hypothetical protein